MKKLSIVIRGGTVVDPARKVYSPGEVLIQGDKIVSPKEGENHEAEISIEAKDCLVFPGLIDFHAHLYAGGTEIGIVPDVGLLPQGVTTAVDAGSAGFANYDGFVHSVVNHSRVRIFALLNVSPAGLVTNRYPENLDPRYFDLDRMRELFERFGSQLIGLKVRQSLDIVGDLGLEPLRETIRVAEALKCRVVVHTTNPPSDSGEIAALLRKGDVFCHAYHGKGSMIIGGDGKISPPIGEARKRGVIFDAANGASHFAFRTALAALSQGFSPDVISSDVTVKTLYGEYVFGLPFLMSKYLSMGMPLEETVAACTATPARILGMEGRIGTLAPGAQADVSIFRLVNRQTTFQDSLGEQFVGNKFLVPQVTICSGAVVYRREGF